MTLLMLLAGAALILLVAYDAIATTLSIGAGAGPITSRITAGWWRLARRLAGRADSPIIVSAGPVVVLLTIGVWLAMLWAGWTLVFAADADAVITSSSRDAASGWSRVYFTGFTVFTLGVGDYIPNGRVWEVLTAVAVVSGLGLTTLAITYLVPIVNAVTSRRVQANTIAGLGDTPQDIVISGLGDHPFAYLEHRLRALSDSLMQTAEQHLSYPVLHYFHSGEHHVDLRTQAYRLDEAITLLQHGVSQQVRPHPAALDAVRHAITQLVHRATTAASEGDLPPPPDLEPLRRAGVPTVDDQAFHQAVAQLADHRRRLAQFANESLWPVTTP